MVFEEEEALEKALELDSVQRVLHTKEKLGLQSCDLFIFSFFSILVHQIWKLKEFCFFGIEWLSEYRIARPDRKLLKELVDLELKELEEKEEEVE